MAFLLLVSLAVSTLWYASVSSLVALPWRTPNSDEVSADRVVSISSLITGVEESPSPMQPSSAKTSEAVHATQVDNDVGSTVLMLFAEEFSKLPWEAMKNSTPEEEVIYEQLLVDALALQLTVPPPVPVNITCGPPTLRKPEEIVCSDYPNAFTGRRREAPPKIGHAIQFGFDLDVLEVHLNEVYDLVDYFFILESTFTHKDMVRKPLMWELVQRQPRYRKFLPKIVHLILDDQESLEAKASGSDIFALESLQERRRYEKIMQWNAITGAFKPGDILGFGDADEVPSREVLQLLRTCHTKGPAVDVGIWFPFGRVDRAFRTDWPVPGHPFTLGDPTFFTLTAEDLDPKNGTVLSRRRGTSGNYLLGGMHMTHYGYFPYMQIKHVTATEYGLRSLKQLKFFDRVRSSSIKQLADEMAEPPADLRKRIFSVDEVRASDKPAIVIPWFLNCNPERYPRWFGKSDPRESIWSFS